VLESKYILISQMNYVDPELEIDNPSDPIHAGQIFAEMLGAACHPEFFDHADVEVCSPPSALLM
jgi:hypothetical protein